MHKPEEVIVELQRKLDKIAELREAWVESDKQFQAIKEIADRKEELRLEYTPGGNPGNYRTVHLNTKLSIRVWEVAYQRALEDERNARDAHQKAMTDLAEEVQHDDDE